MEIRVKPVEDLNKVEYRACLGANYGIDDGYMYSVLQDCRKGVTEGGIAILIWDGPEHTAKSLKAWSLVTPVARSGLMATSYWNRKKAAYSAQFWVKKPYRKKGYAHMLMAEVKKIEPCPHVVPHNEPSTNFFSSYVVTVSYEERMRMKKKPKVA